MGSLVRLRGVDRRGIRDGYRPESGGGAAPFVGVVDALIAAGDTINFAVSCGYQLDTNGGNQIRVRRASDNAEADIGVNASTHLIDSAAIATHCGASDGFGVTTYDRSGNARDFTNATTAEQPKIYDGATGIVLTGSLPMALCTGGAGGAGTGQGWARGDAAGYTGNQAITLFWFGSLTDLTGTTRTCVAMGMAGNAYRMGHYLSTGFGANPTDSSTIAVYRVFNLGTALATPSDFVQRSAAMANISASRLYQRGTELTELGVAAGTYTITTTGSGICANSVQARGITGRWSACIGLNDEPSAAALTALFAFGATLRTTAGV